MNKTQSLTAAELLARRAATAPQGAQADETVKTSAGATGPAYRLPTSPGTVWFRAEDGTKYRRIFPDGIVRCENEREVATMEAMRKVGNCFYHLENSHVGGFQAAPAPIDPNGTN